MVAFSMLSPIFDEGVARLEIHPNCIVTDPDLADYTRLATAMCSSHILLTMDSTALGAVKAAIH
jgi:hypothetical protein